VSARRGGAGREAARGDPPAGHGGRSGGPLSDGGGSRRRPLPLQLRPRRPRLPRKSRRADGPLRPPLPGADPAHPHLSSDARSSPRDLPPLIFPVKESVETVNRRVSDLITTYF